MAEGGGVGWEGGKGEEWRVWGLGGEGREGEGRGRSFNDGPYTPFLRSRSGGAPISDLLLRAIYFKGGAPKPKRT